MNAAGLLLTMTVVITALSLVPSADAGSITLVGCKYPEDLSCEEHVEQIEIRSPYIIGSHYVCTDIVHGCDFG